MAHIKKIKVHAISSTIRGFFWNDETFTTFTDDNGNETYFMGSEEVTKERGNKKYLHMKETNAKWQKSDDCKAFIKRQWEGYHKAKEKGSDTHLYTLHEKDTFQRTVEEYDISYEELIAQLEKRIDHYVDYIDDGGQYRSAVAANDRICNRIKRLQKLIDERR